MKWNEEAYLQAKTALASPEITQDDLMELLWRERQGDVKRFVAARQTRQRMQERQNRYVAEGLAVRDSADAMEGLERILGVSKPVDLSKRIVGTDRLTFLATDVPELPESPSDIIATMRREMSELDARAREKYQDGACRCADGRILRDIHKTRDNEIAMMRFSLTGFPKYPPETEALIAALPRDEQGGIPQIPPGDPDDMIVEYGPNTLEPIHAT